MSLKQINEAIIQDYHFVLGPEYFCITLNGKEKVVITPQEAVEMAHWLLDKSQESYPKNNFYTPVTPSYPALNVPVTSKNEPVYEPGERKATQTRPLPVALGGNGVQDTSDLGVVDLGKQADTLKVFNGA